MNMTKSKPLTVEEQMRNAMAAAQWRGVDPYNSHDAQDREWSMVARVRNGMRARSEAQANWELAQLLREGNEMCELMEIARQAG
jgi:hypothetical protein